MGSQLDSTKEEGNEAAKLETCIRFRSEEQAQEWMRILQVHPTTADLSVWSNSRTLSPSPRRPRLHQTHHGSLEEVVHRCCQPVGCDAHAEWWNASAVHWRIDMEVACMLSRDVPRRPIWVHGRYKVSDA